MISRPAEIPSLPRRLGSRNQKIHEIRKAAPKNNGMARLRTKPLGGIGVEASLLVIGSSACDQEKFRDYFDKGDVAAIHARRQEHKPALSHTLIIRLDGLILYCPRAKVTGERLARDGDSYDDRRQWILLVVFQTLGGRCSVWTGLCRPPNCLGDSKDSVMGGPGTWLFESAWLPISGYGASRSAESALRT